MSDKPKKIMIGFGPRHLEMLEELKDKTGIKEYTALIRNAVTEYYRKLMPDYVAKKYARELSPEEASQRQEDIKNAKIAAERKTYTTICEKLGGKVVGNTCVYNTFSIHASYEQSLPLDHLDETLLDTQFFPDRETIEKLVADGKLKAALPPKLS